MHSQAEILTQVRSTLVDLFKMDAAEVTTASRLSEDLGIDSIDVVDLMDEVQKFSGKKVSPDDFRAVRTVGDLVAVIERLQRS